MENKNKIITELWYAVDKGDNQGHFFKVKPDRFIEEDMQYWSTENYWNDNWNDGYIEIRAEQLVEIKDLPQITWENEPMPVKFEITFAKQSIE